MLHLIGSVIKGKLKFKVNICMVRYLPAFLPLVLRPSFGRFVMGFPLPLRDGLTMSWSKWIVVLPSTLSTTTILFLRISYTILLLIAGTSLGTSLFALSSTSSGREMPLRIVSPSTLFGWTVASRFWILQLHWWLLLCLRIF